MTLALLRCWCEHVGRNEGMGDGVGRRQNVLKLHWASTKEVRTPEAAVEASFTFRAKAAS